MIESIKERLNNEVSRQNPLIWLKNEGKEAKEVDFNDIIDSAVSVIYLYTRDDEPALLVEMITAIGNSIRDKYELRRDTASSARIGAFLLYSFELNNILKTKLAKGSNGHNTYIVEILNEEDLSKLWATVKAEKTEKLPSLTPYADWVSGKHETGVLMVKTNSKEVISSLDPQEQPMLFECLNRSQRTGWQVNEAVLSLFSWALRNKAEAFADIWELQNPEAKASKLREAKTVESIAQRMLNKTFYHMYYYDFRGRKYPATAYFHEQGADGAKGLLLRQDKKAIGEQGFFWLLISIASNWAGDSGNDRKTDKIPLNDRVHWVLDNKEIILSYANEPKVNQGWMNADKPWQFLAACLEYKKVVDWEEAGNDPYEFESSLECFIDGSNNGSQHLSALTHDEETAPHVNLVPLVYPGDLYKYVADHVWLRINAQTAKLSRREKAKYDNVIDTLIDLKQSIQAAPLKSDRRKELIEEIKKFKLTHKDDIRKASCVYWSRITDEKHRRKVVKRNVMTLPYGGTAYGLGQQQIDDARKHGIDQLMSMEHIWGSYIGREVFEDCKESLRRPMRLLSVFEEAGRKAEAKVEFLRWKVPITNFPVVQHYTEGTVKLTWVQYGPIINPKPNGENDNSLRLSVCYPELPKPAKGKQSQAASPNAIHSLDAAHLTIATCRADFPITTIHDSFGCLLGDMPELFCLIRETFVELYQADPLTSLMEDINGDVSNVELGTLNVEEILESEYAFA